ncbi:hypothetical protein TSOC_011077, partial [Tetrabaena socialis]
MYIGLLKLYDLVNQKLPYHVRVPSIDEVNLLLDKYDVNGNRRLEFPEFLETCKGLIGTRKNWRDSLFLKIGVAVAMKALVGPGWWGPGRAGKDRGAATCQDRSSRRSRNELLSGDGFPYMAGLIKAGVSQLGITQIQGVPVGAITFMIESAAKQLT